MKILTLVAGILLICTPAGHAGPLESSHVSADAKWVLHLNLQAARKWELVDAWRTKAKKHEKYEEFVEKMSDKLGMNPMEDLLGVTVYDNAYARHNGVVILHLKRFDRDKLSAAFKEKHPNHKTEKYGSRTISTWTAKMGHHKKRTVAGCFVGNTAILMSSDSKRVKEALDVIDGERKSLDKNSALLDGFTKEAILACRAIDVDGDYKQNTRCPVLKRCQEATMSFTVRKGDVDLKYDLVADSEEVAGKIKEAVEGFQAIIGLQVLDDEDAQEMLDALKVTVDDESLSIRWSAASDELTEFVQNRMAKFKKMRGQWDQRKRRGHHRHKKDREEDGDDDDDDDHRARDSRKTDRDNG